MQRSALFAFSSALVLLVAGAGGARAQGIPDGVYASDKEGCAKLKTKSAKELGPDLDFYVLTKKGIVSGDQACDFINVYDHDAKSWVATTFCNEHGYTFPDLVSIAAKQDGSLDVTRMSDISGTSGGDQTTNEEQAGSDEGAAPSAQDSGNAAGAKASDNGGASDDEGADDETLTNYARCDGAKP